MTEFDCTVKNCGRRACDPVKCKLYKEDNMSEARELFLKDPSVYYPGYINELEQQNKELIEAIEYFVKRVESGSVRSTKTYTKYKEILNKYKDK